MRNATHADAELLIQLYELRRDPELRRARQWFLTDFSASSWTEIKLRYLTHSGATWPNTVSAIYHWFGTQKSLAFSLPLFFLFNAYPVVRGLLIAFSDYRYLIPDRAPFNGVDHWIEMVGDIVFWQSLGRSLEYTAIYVVLNFGVQDQWVSVPFPENGPWTDLLANFDGSWAPTVSDYHLDVLVGSHWGNVFFREG